MSERTMEKARQVVHRLSEWYFSEGGDNDPDSPIDREDLDALHDLVRTAEATLRTPRGEGENTIPVSALRSEIAQLRAHRLLPYLAWARLCALAGGEPVGEDTPAALRSEAQGEDRWEDVVFGPITQAYNEAHAARRGEGGGDGE